MGVEIVKASIVHGKRLSGNAYKVLVVMAMSALDKPRDGRPAGLYWGGWDALAVALGYDDALRGSAGHNAVARAVRELKKGRHVSPMVTARIGSRQSYLVHPGGISAPKQGEQNAHAQGEQNAHAQGEQNAHTVREQNAHTSVSKTLTPRKEQDSEGLIQDTSITSETKPQRGVGETSSNEIRPHKFDGDPTRSDCLTCQRSYLDKRAHPLHLLRGA